MGIKQKLKTASKKFKQEFMAEFKFEGGENLPPVTEEELENFDRTKYKGFDRVGYSRPLGGWIYQFFYAILGAGLIAIIYPVMLGYIYPYPEIKGYVDISGVLFSILFFAFNVPTNFAIERWVADYRVKNPKKMVQYMSFYIWYQMFTGLVLITITSLYIFWIVTTGNFAYAAWILLVLITREYPAMLNIFLQSIKGLQAFQYESKINFIKQIWEKAFELAFVLFGTFVIGRNPKIGGLLGAAIGYSIGTYIDDFLSAFLSAWYIKRPLEEMGLSLKDVLRPNFTREIALQSFIFGLKLSIPGIINSFIGFTSTIWWYNLVPQFVTFQTLNKLADEIANISKRSEGINTKGAFSEAINNGKYKLAQYYIANTFKYYGFFTVGISCAVIGYLPLILEVLLSIGEAENYLLAIPFILPNILHTLIEQPAGEADKILVMGNKPLFKSFTEILRTGMGFLFTYLYLFVFKLPQTFGINAIIWLLPMGSLAPDLIRLGLNWWYVNKAICPLKKPLKSIAWQAFVAPLIPGAITIVTGYLWYFFLFPHLSAALTPIVAATISVLFAFVFGLIFCFIVLYGFFGGWDEHSLEVFKEAIQISGPSRIFFRPVYK
ncbi:hypothetical protein GF325_08320, partial [Candidatus Bathyarchaeota archaeon]|nr:hypothetical protein [Candidatus Bathyarchaeota archaeon]